MNVDNESLRKIVNYWLRCIESEDALGAELSPRARTRSALSPLSVDPFVFGSEDEVAIEDKRLRRLLEDGRARGEDIYYGYPVLLFRDKHGERLTPLLIVKLEVDADGGVLVAVREERTPDVGITALRRMGLDGEEAGTVARGIASLFEGAVVAPPVLAGRFVDYLSSEVGPEFVDEISPGSVSSTTVSGRGRYGVFNRAVFYRGEPTTFNRALREDLGALGARVDAGTTALGRLLATGASDERDEAPDPPALAFEANEYQIAAIRRALSGSHTVVTGPPGTGKSQFIENLLLTLFLAGKRVLLVSHTNEAVHVVHERITQEIGQLAMRTGSLEYRKSLRDQYQSAVRAIQGSGRSAGSRAAELSEHWEALLRERQELNEVRLLHKQANALASRLAGSAEALGSVSLVFEFARAIGPLLDDAEKRVAAVELMREVEQGVGPVLLRLLRRWLPRAFARACQRRLQRLASIVSPSMREIVTGDHGRPLFGSVQSSDIDKAKRLLRFARSSMELFGVEAEIRRRPRPAELEEGIVIHTKRYAEVSREAGRARIHEALLGQGPGAGAIGAFLDQIANRRGDDESSPVAPAMDRLPIWSCTLKSLRQTFPLAPDLFDYVVFDEASQVDLPSAAPALYRARRSVVVGDPMQLTHIATITRDQERMIAAQTGVSKLSDVYPSRVRYDEVNLYRAAERALHVPPVLLAQHYRSQAEIIELCNDVFYDSRLRVMTNNDYDDWPSSVPRGLEWEGCHGVSTRHPAGSRCNAEEVQQVISLLRFLVTAFADRPVTIGVVTPFSRQRNIIADRVQREFAPDALGACDLKIQTAHQFQGSERDIMIFSLVVSGRGDGGSDRWFNSYPQILNVALSRARKLLYIVGDLESCRSRGGILGKIAAAYTTISARRATAAQSLAGNLDTAEESILFERLSRIYGHRDAMQLVPKRLVGPYALDIALEGTVKVDIECDGHQHEIVDGLPVIDDVRRDQYLRRHGWKVLRVPNHRVYSDMDGVLAEIAALVEAPESEKDRPNG